MSGIFELDELLRTMKPELLTQEYVFCSVEGELKEYISLNPIGTFVEQEGLTLVLEKDVALKENIPFDGVFRQITLTVHSSLDAVSLTAAVSTKLASKGISANVVAAFYHDHIFVPSSKAELALSALKEIE
ncbi:MULTISPECIES: ACT domain-containing protein [Aliivibrio]|uniref:ACT domain-containing protein n=1 Tax=Aliivibrio TaxID=511678 RepID=UPI00080DE91D|nr:MULTISPECIES: ACT domain-containing protein [Aliivibrio]MBD1570129.1 ACT domain-containing protein [Aliivibrio sp. S10_S31]OCH26705.1 transporter [Aliivibrio fischeri]